MFCVSELRGLGAFQLKLELVCDKRNKLRIGGLTLGVGHGVPKEPLEGIQIPSVPGNLNGMPDSPLHAARRGLEGFRHLRVQYLGDGVDGVPDGPPEGFQKGAV